MSTVDEKTGKTLDRIADLEKEFGFDVETTDRLDAGVILPEHRSSAVRLGRRALEVAFMDARQALLAKPGPVIDDFQETARAAQAAAEALNTLISALDPKATADWQLALPLQTSQSGVILLPNTAEGIRNAQAELRKDAAALFRAKAVADRVAKAALTKRNQLATQRKNDPAPDHRAFLFRLAEMWIFLTGRLPGSNKTKNEFLPWAMSGWEDVFGSDAPAFGGALKATLAAMSPAAYERLKRLGPDWI